MPNLTPTESIFKALMHPSRMMILDILRDGEQCVCHLEAVLGCRQAYISQHLMVLRDAGLVDDRRDGTRVFYRVIKPEIYELIDYANQMSGATSIKANGKVDNCPCPKCNPTVDKTDSQK
jgi:ArsR family transcriptional regulator